MSRSLLRSFAALALATAVAGLAPAQQTTVQNDSYVEGGGLVAVGDFAVGERAASWLTSPCDGRIVALQVLWASAFGGSPPSVEDNISVFAAGTFPNPGAELLKIEGPQLTDGFVNEFRFVDENQTVPVRVPVLQGQTFVVSLQFSTATNVGAGSGSVVRDTDNIQPNRNAIFAILGPGSAFWFNSQTLGLQGDFVIRAVVNCQAPDAASAPSPASGATNVSSTPTLSWTGSDIARNYDVFLWPASESQPATPVASAITTTSITVTTPLEPDTFYAWRIISRNNTGINTGPIWQFRTAGIPGTPTPSPTEEPTATPSPSPTEAPTATETPTSTPEPSPTDAPSPTPSPSPEPTPTATPLPGDSWEVRMGG